MEHMSIARATQHMVAEILLADEWFASHRVKIIEQNSQELATMIRTKLEGLHGPVLVVATDSERNEHPATEVTTTIFVTEAVPVNRMTPCFATAIEVVEAAVDDLDGHDWHWDGEIRHETPGDGILTATCSFRALVGRGPNEDDPSQSDS